VLSTLLAATALTAAPPATDGEPVARLVARLLAAPTVEEGRAVAGEIVALAPDFQSVLRALGEERRYPDQVPVGLIEGARRNRDGTLHRYLLAVPEDYAPGGRYPVRVLLHGGVERPEWKQGGGWWRDPKRLLREDHISIVPASWSGSRWWDASQVENVAGILRDVKRQYDVDENRVSQLGISDGGSGVWFFAFKDATPWACFLSFIGHPGVLTNPSSRIDGPLLTANLRGRPFLAVNGSDDPLYPAEGVRPLLDVFEEAGAQIRFEVVEGGGHDLRFWSERAAAIDEFVSAHPRDPLPDRVVWATDRTDRYNRAWWVVIEELAEGGLGDASAPGVPSPLPERLGGVDVRRSGNAIDVQAQGVRRLRLLLSPQELDLSGEITVVTNGSLSFQGRIEPRLDTLLEWAARDVDRELLFAAELAIDVPPSP
jgi:predicted esterase